MFSSSVRRVPKESLFSRIRSGLNHFLNGSKLLFRHSQRVREVKRKNENDWTREERLLLEQFRYDIKVGIPFVSLFALPIIGYSAPLLALLAPRYLPSTLILPQQKERFFTEDARVSRDLLPSLIRFNEERTDDERLDALLSTSQILREVMDDRLDLRVHSLRYSQLFERSMSLDRLRGEHLFNLHRCVLHSSFLSKSFRSNWSLRTDLDRWEETILRDDRTITNVADLSSLDLISSLRRRGLYLHLHSSREVLNNEFKTTKIDVQNDWKALLQSWIDIHLDLQTNNCLSISYLLHLPRLLLLNKR